MNANEIRQINRENASRGNVSHELNKNATPKEFVDQSSALFSRGGTFDKSQSNMKSDMRLKDGTDIEQMDKKSADFGTVSNTQSRKLSQTDMFEKTDNLGPRDIARGGKKGGGP